MRLLLAASLIAVPAAAQGTLGGQGFGYPAGQLSSRAVATGGALGAFDGVSPVNPASVATWQRTVLFFHIEPEYRTTSIGDVNSSTRVSRFPLAGVAARIGSRGAGALTMSTYLDRTWETAATGSDSVGGEEIDLTTRYSSNGAINDIRAAFAWSFTGAFRAGVAYHAYTGENRLRIQWDFPDGSVGDVTQTSVLGYSGGAVSFGGELTAAKKGAVAAYARVGGAARIRLGDTLVAEGDMPTHLGVALRYDGFAGTTIAGGWERVEWSAMAPLASSTLGARDGDRFSLGVETRGPSVGQVPMFLRAGALRRTLPFSAMGVAVRETGFSFGAGITLAQGRGSLDLALQRALRSAGTGRERAWLFSFGLAISP